jgi:DNA polymerase-4
MNPHNLRHILHMDLDTFFVSCERLLDSRLVGRPVLVGGTSDRGVVAACSYEARQFGIHSAMPMRMAKQLCPEAIVVRGNSGTYSKLSRTVTEIIQEQVPLFEKTSIDEFYIDLTGMDRFFGCQKLATELRQKVIKETGLPISFGLSENKTVSKIATGQAKPNNQRYVDHGQEKPFLAPLSVAKIPMVGKVTYKQLCDLGIKRIFTLQEMPVEFLLNVFGKNGQQIWNKANGIDKSPVVPYTERQSISTERTFNRDTTDHQKLRSILVAMAENLAFQLRRGHKLTGCVAVKIRYSDFQTYTQQQKIAYSAADHNIIPTVMALYEKLYQRRMLVRLIGVRLSDLVAGGHQIDLFNDAEKTIKLYQAMDLMRERYGDRSIMRAVGMEARTIGRINPFNGEPPALLANRKQ